jgi:tetratricopeptide (TPR) repeat protein
MSTKSNDHQQQFNEALEFYFQERYEEAATLFQFLLKEPDLSPHHQAQSHRRLGSCLVELGEPEKGLLEIEKALSLTSPKDPLYCWVLESKASTLVVLMKFEEAIACYRQAISKVTELADLDYMELQLEEALEAMESGPVEERKQAVLAALDAKLAEINQAKKSFSQDEFNRYFKDKPKLVS